MGVPATCAVALTIEVLSSVCDGLLFMVPAKSGRRRRPKRRSSRAPARGRAQGFSFGLVRHVRELLWASAGFLIYALQPPAD